MSRLIIFRLRLKWTCPCKIYHYDTLGFKLFHKHPVICKTFEYAEKLYSIDLLRNCSNLEISSYASGQSPILIEKILSLYKKNTTDIDYYGSIFLFLTQGFIDLAYRFLQNKPEQSICMYCNKTYTEIKLSIFSFDRTIILYCKIAYFLAKLGYNIILTCRNPSSLRYVPLRRHLNNIGIPYKTEPGLPFIEFSQVRCIDGNHKNFK